MKPITLVAGVMLAATGAGFTAVLTAQPPPSSRVGRAVLIDGPAGQISVDDGGRGGTPVVFVHSLAGNRSQWAAQLEHLRGKRRAVALDLRGHGGSDPAADGDYSLEALADDVHAVVNHLNLRQVVLVGHSLGGGVVAVYAGRHPHRVAGLLFADPIGDQRRIRQQMDIFVQTLAPETYEQAIEMYWQSILRNADATVRGQVLQALKATPREAVVGAYEGMMTFDPAATLEPYPGPMLAVISDLNSFPFSLHNVVPGLPTRHMTSTSHWLHMDRPEEFNRYLDELLARVGGS